MLILPLSMLWDDCMIVGGDLVTLPPCHQPVVASSCALIASPEGVRCVYVCDILPPEPLWCDRRWVEAEQCVLSSVTVNPDQGQGELDSSGQRSIRGHVCTHTHKQTMHLESSLRRQVINIAVKSQGGLTSISFRIIVFFAPRSSSYLGQVHVVHSNWNFETALFTCRVCVKPPELERLVTSKTRHFHGTNNTHQCSKLIHGLYMFIEGWQGVWGG